MVTVSRRCIVHAFHASAATVASLRTHSSFSRSAVHNDESRGADQYKYPGHSSALLPQVHFYDDCYQAGQNPYVSDTIAFRKLVRTVKNVKPIFPKPLKRGILSRFCAMICWHQKVHLFDETAKNPRGVMRMNDEELKRYVDAEKALARIRGNTKLFRLLLGTFLENPHFAQLEQEMAAGDREAAAKTAHAIKGASANLSLMAVYELSQTLEASLKSDADTAEAFTAFKTAYNETIRAIDIVIKGLPS